MNNDLTIFGTIGIVCISILFLSWLINRYRSQKWLQSPAFPGKLIDIGDRKIYLRIQGDLSKKYPAVILDTACGMPSVTFWPIQDELSKLTQVITYDRAGYGWSNPDPKPHTADRAVEDLHSILDKAGVKGPFILVGNSLGGLFLFHFAQQFPADVKAVVLLDAAPLENRRFKEEISPKAYDLVINRLRGLNKIRFLAKFGILRHVNLFGQYLPTNLNRVVREYFCLDFIYPAILSEYNNLETSITQIQQGHHFPPIPLIVVTHSRQVHLDYCAKFGESVVSSEEANKIEDLWEETYRLYLQYSPLSKWVIAPKSGHTIPLDQPDLVIQLVKDLL